MAGPFFNIVPPPGDGNARKFAGTTVTIDIPGPEGPESA